MNNFVYVEFLFRVAEIQEARTLLSKLGNDFIELECTNEHITYWRTGVIEKMISVTGKINSEAATAIKLSDSLLSEHMNVFFISSKLKDKYRNR